MTVTAEDGTTAPLGIESSKALWDHLKTEGYVDARGRVQDRLRAALREGGLTLPGAVESERDRITGIPRKLAGRKRSANPTFRE